MLKDYKKIILPTRPHPDTIVGIFILQTFGEEKYPGIKNAKIDIWQNLPESETIESLDEKGTVLIDVGGGKFDHHKAGRPVSLLIAEDLEVQDDPGLKKLLAYSERDDKYGLGTISTDPLDKAFGLSGLIAALNKTLSDNPQRVVEIALLLIRAHYIEEKKRTEEMPKEFKEALETGKAEVFEVKHKEKKIKVVILESDNTSMAGWLRSVQGEKADVVCQKASSGYVNILTRPLKRIDLRWPIAYLRSEEAKLRKISIRQTVDILTKEGKLPEMPEWYYDKATNSILNGGTNPNGISPTLIPLRDIRKILEDSLSREI